MKLTKSKLKRLIVEEITRSRQGPFYDARSIIFNLIERMRHEERMERPVIISSRAGDDIDVLAELSRALELLIEHDKEMEQDLTLDF